MVNCRLTLLFFANFFCSQRPILIQFASKIRPTLDRLDRYMDPRSDILANFTKGKFPIAYNFAQLKQCKIFICLLWMFKSSSRISFSWNVGGLF